MLLYVCILFISQLVYTILYYFAKNIAKFISAIIILTYAYDSLSHFPYRGILLLYLSLMSLFIFFYITKKIL